MQAEEDIPAPSLREVVEQESLRWIFVGGKGGVGKTTTSCSLAVELASRRESVLLLSTDPAHNLSDCLRQKVTSSPTVVDGFDNLFAMEIDASINETLGFQLSKNQDNGGFQKMIKDLMGTFPGVDEAMGFAELMRSVQSMPYSVIVFDTAPTGHTLRLLGFPEMLDKGLLQMGDMQGSMGGLFQMVQSMTEQETSDEDVQQRMSNLRATNGSVQETFQDPTKCTFICVCIPEFLSVYETERLVQELCKRGIDSGNLVVNQVLFPEDCGMSSNIEAEEDNACAVELDSLETQLQKLDPKLAAVAGRAAARMRRLEKGFDMCQKKCNVQAKYLGQIKDLYQEDFHIVPVPLLGEEVRGVERLRTFARLLLGGDRSLPEFSPPPRTA